MFRFLFVLAFMTLVCASSNAQTESQTEVSKIQSERFPRHKRCKESLTNENLKKCTIEKITNFVKMSFDLELADRLFPQDKSTKFKVNFNINKKGKINNITAKAFKREIAVEAIKILKRLPKLKQPGFKNGDPVNTPFELTMTIYF